MANILIAGKKLKRRLEDLERRAGSSSASPEQSHQELVQPVLESVESDAPSIKRRASSNSKQINPRQMSDIVISNYMPPQNDRSLFTERSSRQLTASPPPSFSYSSYSSSDSGYYPSYSQAQSYQSQYLPLPYSNMPYQDQYISSMPQSLPNMTSSFDMKREPLFLEDEAMNPFGMSYASLGGNEYPIHGHQDTNAQVNTTDFF